MSNWILEDGSKAQGIVIKENFSKGEYIVAKGKKILVAGNVEVILSELHIVNFDVFGLYSPHLRCTDVSYNKVKSFRDEYDSPKIFDEQWKKYMSRKEFSGDVGRLMIERLPDILNYKFSMAE